MAFHPFNIFRKHQKVWFAVLTIVCMFVFILQFGSGDLIQRLLGGGAHGGGEKVVTLYGKDLTAGDLTQIRQSRQLGNELIHAALQGARKQASQDLEDYKADTSNATDQEIQTLRESWLQRKDMQEHLLDGVTTVEQLKQKQQQLQFYQQLMLPRDYASVIDLAGRVAGGDKADAAKAKEQEAAVANLRFLLRAEFYESARAASPFYFGGGVKDADLLDFEIWKHQAETLGVVLTKADVRRALAYEAGGNGLPADPGGPWRADPAFKDVFAAHPDATEDQAAKAVEDEFRVHMAQDLLGGPAAGVAALDQADRVPPDPVAPYDFWTYFRDNRTTLKVAFLSLPVESFVGKVATGPTPQELLALYNQGRSTVPDPSSSAPAFKEPRRTRIAYLTARTDSEYYKDLIDHLQYNRVRNCFYAAHPINMAGGGVVSGLALAGVLAGDPLAGDRASDDPMAAFRPAVDQLPPDYAEADAGRRAGASEVSGVVGLGAGGLAPWSAPAAALLASANERQREASRLAIAGRRAAATAAAEVGGAVGLSLGDVGPWLVPAVQQAYANQEASRLASAGLSLPLIGSASGAPVAGLAGALTPPQALEQILEQAPEGTYTDLVDRYFWEDQRKNDLSRIVDADLERLAKALPDEIKRGREAAEQQNAENKGKNVPQVEDLDQYAYEKAELFIRAQCRLYGWELHDGAGLDDIFHLQTDPVLLPLLQGLPREFGGPSEVAKFMLAPNAPGLYTAMGPFPTGAAETKYVFWRTQEERERDFGEAGSQVPNEALPRVKETWLKQQACKLALRKAKEVSDGAKAEWLKFEPSSQGQQDNLMQFLTDQNLGKVFVLDKVSRLLAVPNKDEHGATYNDYTPYTIPASQIADAPSDLLDRLLALEKPGDTYIFRDKPTANVYVAVLEQRDAPEFQSDDWHKEFADDYRSATNSQTGGLWQKFLAKRKQDYQKALMRRLREEAGPVNEQGQLVLSGKAEKQQAPTGSEDEPPPEMPLLGQ